MIAVELKDNEVETEGVPSKTTNHLYRMSCLTIYSAVSCALTFTLQISAPGGPASCFLIWACHVI